MRVEVRDARRIARLLLAMALASAPIALLLWIARPGGIGPMFSYPLGYEDALPVVGMGGWLIGLAGMIRIYHADPEAGDRSWRYRD